MDTEDIADTVATADTADTADTDATEAMVDTADMADTTDELTADHSSFIGSLIFKLIVSRSTFGLEYSGLTSNWILLYFFIHTIQHVDLTDGVRVALRK